ncbi:MAG: hypothetical protein AAF225_09575, partial [Pseudomonadota bacterium]
ALLLLFVLAPLPLPLQSGLLVQAQVLALQDFVGDNAYAATTIAPVAIARGSGLMTPLILPVVFKVLPLIIAHS